MDHLPGQKHKLKRRRKSARKPTTQYTRFLDRITFIAGIVGPFTVLPQVWDIFSTHSAVGVSLATWLLIFIVTLPWIFYGFAHKDKSIIASFVLWEIANISVVIGVLMYS